MSASHSKVVVDHEGDLSSSQEPILFLGFLLLQADLLFELVFRAEAIFASSISNFGKFFPQTDREDFNSSKESNNYTSLIHNIASDGKIRTSSHVFFEFSTPKTIVDREFVELQFRYLLSLLSNHVVLR